MTAGRFLASSPRGVYRSLTPRRLPGLARPHPLIQLQRAAGNAAVAHIAADAFPLRGSGAALEPSVRRFMEPRLGFELDGVRVHANREAAIAARAVGARAFTFGRDIVFGTGEYQPHSTGGRNLLAHELAHVVQQSASGNRCVQRQPKKSDQPDWQRQLDEILPGHVGLIADIYRFTTLLDALGAAELARVVPLIHASKAARALVTQHGAPGIVAIADTLTRKRLDVPATALDIPAAEFLLAHFPSRTRESPKPDPKAPAAAFPVDVVRDAYVEFHRNAFLDKEDEHKKQIRKNCIAIVHEMVPRLFTDPKVVKEINKGLTKVKEKGETFTMVHTGKELVGAGVADAPIEIRFKDKAGKATNGNTEPKEMVGSAWKDIGDAVGKAYGWHIFGMAVMDGHHSVTLFVDNRPDGRSVYWADQWNIGPGQNFKEVAGAISGFREYSVDGFDPWINKLTTDMWNSVHKESDESKCYQKHKKTWDTSCRYTATLRIWHLHRSAGKKAGSP